jgi:hypothetical protein
MTSNIIGNTYSIEIDTGNEKLKLFKNNEIIREYIVFINKPLKHPFKGFLENNKKTTYPQRVWGVLPSSKYSLWSTRGFIKQETYP